MLDRIEPTERPFVLICWLETGLFPQQMDHRLFDLGVWHYVNPILLQEYIRVPDIIVIRYGIVVRVMYFIRLSVCMSTNCHFTLLVVKLIVKLFD